MSVKWEYPDIKKDLEDRDKVPVAAPAEPEQFDFPAFLTSSPGTAIVGEDQYVLDMDYAEAMGVGWEDLIQRKK